MTHDQSLPTADQAVRRRRVQAAAAIGAAALTVSGVALLALPSAAQDQPERVVPAAAARSAAVDSGSVSGSVLVSPEPLAVASAPALSAPSAAAVVSDPVVPPASAPVSVPAPASEPVPAAEPAPAAPAVPAVPASIVLEGDGLGVAADASIRRLAFGSDAATIRAVVSAALGEGTQNPLPDCGADVSVVQYGPLASGFTLVLDGDAFVGWSTNNPTQSSANSVRVGMTAVELRGSGFADVAFSQGTLGPEWSAGGLAGFIDGTTDAAEVIGVHAGQACLAR